MDDLFGPLFGQTAIATATDDRAWLAALCETEGALARACARAGLIELAAAMEVARAADDLSRSDPADLGREAVAGGNPVIPLVEALRKSVPAEAVEAVHFGATSQDVLDTAMMLVAHRGLGVLLGDLADCANTAAALARAHRDTAMCARTLLQQAMPTTFGALAATWGSGLDRSLARLRTVRAELPVQLGGAAGTLAALGPGGLRVLAALAEELDLAEPAGVWHTDRGVVAELAGALGQAGTAIAKPATDVVLLAQNEIDELREHAPGGSSAMAHKQNPIAAITARAGAAQAPGLVATLLAAGAPELQRGAGGWHAEWPALTALLRATGGAASRLRDSLTGLDVHAESMRRNLTRLADTVGTSDVGAAGELVDRYLERRRS